MNDIEPFPSTDSMVEIGTGMSNYDHTIEPGFAEKLQAQPNKVFGLHAGWDFNGRVWWDGELFWEEVWHYHMPQQKFSAPTLHELMEVVNKEWGWD